MSNSFSTLIPCSPVKARFLYRRHVRVSPTPQSRRGEIPRPHFFTLPCRPAQVRGTLSSFQCSLRSLSGSLSIITLSPPQVCTLHSATDHCELSLQFHTPWSVRISLPVASASETLDSPRELLRFSCPRWSRPRRSLRSSGAHRTSPRAAAARWRRPRPSRRRAAAAAEEAAPSGGGRGRPRCPRMTRPGSSPLPAVAAARIW